MQPTNVNADPYPKHWKKWRRSIEEDGGGGL
jgi:hypothetical protein